MFLSGFFVGIREMMVHLSFGKKGGGRRRPKDLRSSYSNKVQEEEWRSLWMHMMD